MPVGRPTKLTKALIDKADQHVDEDTIDRALLPTIEGLAMKLGVSRDTLYAWEGESERFSDILEKLRQAQAFKLIQLGLQGRYNPTIAKMMLSKHGYVEKSQTDLTSDGKAVGPVLVKFVGGEHEE